MTSTAPPTKAAYREVEVQHQLTQNDQPARDINVTADRAALRARRVTRAMVAEENGRVAIRTLTPMAGG